MKGSKLIKNYEDLKEYMKEHDAVFLEVRGLKGVQVFVNGWSQSFGKGMQVSFLAYCPNLVRDEYNIRWRCWRMIPTEEEQRGPQWD